MLSESERARVRAAVDAAEAGLAAEIVPCVFARSGSYPEAVWAGATLGAAFACAALWLTDAFSPSWLPVRTLMLAVPDAGFLGAALGRWCAPFTRLLVGAASLEQSAARRAKEVFFDRGIDRARRRDGVLIFVSVLERRVVVLADAGVRAPRTPDAWAPAVAALTEAAARGRVVEGLVAAVARVGAALRAAGASGAHGGELGRDPIVEDGA